MGLFDNKKHEQPVTPDRSWVIVTSRTINGLYEAASEYEELGFSIVPASYNDHGQLNVAGWTRYSILLRR